MNLERERQALRYLEEALDWPVREREKRLHAALGHLPDLLKDVRELLATADSISVALPTEMPVTAHPDDAPPPERIGPYRLGALLGQGGMGRVYRAERADGVFEQTIAIKLMRRTRMPLRIAEQFGRERQILARLQHRNIAHLYDGGVTPEGLSYFVMELVEGRPISQYAAEEQLALKPTLMLFRQVCAAVQHAHANLVVHADIKPNNILVTNDGTAKLLDFGVARVIEDVGDPTAAPSGSLGITQYYASPARRRGEAPSTIDDVYSLGVLLNELLKRFIQPPIELRSICKRAAADDPAVRYASVDALKEDIERWLAGLPVQAHGTAWSYIVRKFLARHRFAVSSAAVVVLMLAAGATALAILYVRAEHAKTQAEQRFKDVRELSRYVLFDVYDRLESIPRALTLRRDIAVKGQRYLDELANVPDAPLDVRLEVVEGLRRLAQVQGEPGSASLAQVPLALANLARAEKMARALPDDARWSRDRSLALARINLVRTRISMSQELNLQEARRALDETQRLLAPWVVAEDTAAEALATDLAVERAANLQWDGKYAESIAVARAGLKAEKIPVDAPPPERRAASRRHARLLDILAESMYYAGDVVGAEAPYREQYQILQRLSEEEPLNLRAARAYMRAGWALGSTLLDLGRNRAEEAERYLASSDELARKLLVLEPDDRDLVRSRSISAAAEGQALSILGRTHEGIALLQDSVNARLQLWQASPADWAVARDYAKSLQALGDTRLRVHDVSQACGNYREAFDVFERMRNAGRLPKLDEGHTLKPLNENLSRYCGPEKTELTSRR